MARKSTPDEYTDYVAALTGWDWSYSFGVNFSRVRADPYMEFRHLQLTGRLLGPKMAKCLSASVVLIPDINVDESLRLDSSPVQAVGGVEARAGVLHGTLSVPQSALEGLLTVLCAGRFEALIMHGRRLRYRRAQIVSYRLVTKLDYDEVLLE